MSELTMDESYKNIRISIDGTIIATQEIIDRVSISYGCVDGSSLGIGTTFSPRCDVEINSNDIISNSALDLLKMNKIFIVECELTEGTYTPLGRFEIGEPAVYTDDYSVSFSGEGMVGSILARKYMNWNLMEEYTDKGVLTVSQALQIIHDQFNVTIETPSAEYLPENFSQARIVVPTSLKKWKKGVAYAKRFVKLTGREFIGGIACMMGGNLIEYGNYIRIVTLKEVLSNSNNNYFTEDSFNSDFTYEKKPYAPKEIILKTYETVPVQTKKKNKTTTHGYCYGTECECNSVYSYIGNQNVNQYTVNVECQWIGRSFEAFYFSGSVSGESGIYEDATPIRKIGNMDLSFTPISLDFSGWSSEFFPSNFLKIQGTRKNTETQTETTYEISTYIADMTIEWDGNITTQVSSAYSGDGSEITIVIDHNEITEAWDDGTNIPDYATQEIVIPYGNWNYANEASTVAYY